MRRAICFGQITVQMLGVAIADAAVRMRLNDEQLAAIPLIIIVILSLSLAHRNAHRK